MAVLTEFEVGYVLALCNVAHGHDKPEIASDALLMLGKTRRQIVTGFDWTDYDRGALRAIFAARPSDWKFTARRTLIHKKGGDA